MVWVGAARPVSKCLSFPLLSRSAARTAHTEPPTKRVTDGFHFSVCGPPTPGLGAAKLFPPPPLAWSKGKRPTGRWADAASRPGSVTDVG